MRRNSALERARAAKAAKEAGAGAKPAVSASSSERLMTTGGQQYIEHTPRVNPSELPPQSQADIDHARLRSRLEAFGLREREVEGDGNCQFRALSDQIYASQEHHMLVRMQAVEQLLLAADRYKDYVVAQTYDEYVQKMSLEGAWGDHVTLQAVADRIGVDINLVTSFEDRDGGTGMIRVRSRPMPDTPPSDGQPLWLSFWAEIHYQSIVDE